MAAVAGLVAHMISADSHPSVLGQPPAPVVQQEVVNPIDPQKFDIGKNQYILKYVDKENNVAAS